MNNKIPCGGFYLSDTLGVDDNGKLGVNGGEPYKSLVTDGDGSVKWEDRLAYVDSRLVIDAVEGGKFVRVADEIPSWAAVDVPIKVWDGDGDNYTTEPEMHINLGNGSFSATEFAVFIATDNVEFPLMSTTVVFPKKGVYFSYVPDSFYTKGIASADSDTPEITWDGNVGTLKTIDQKYIPPQVVYVKATRGDRTETATGEYYTNVTLDKTYDEISALVSQGVDVKIVTYDNYVLNYARFDKYGIEFSACEPDDINEVAITCAIYPDNFVKISFYYLDYFYLRIDSDGALRDPLILHSSTPGSSKKFKITVDDSGAISATAV